ncbi:2-oxoglutarate dehydrogenase E1 component [Peribacillus cavernae]|uniref:2-oxoglutarate dehydrogenase E1 component n=1 Tax=Peribacillus cavernae TaxID=1674310 RepID=A0A3S0WCP4_9BACI|nr:2-oxoglutarate dehydrogenase E1 component [Peribacillus cavernae]MDQ0217874.1 2-oxoglutarate dehydrogenase E1 component [Peribacillus cavernae]RUQ32538.1 2-oxoglutarate dehydrogenase E1 component [Peribacillus cavernae]
MTNNDAKAYDPWKVFSGPNLGYVMEQFDLYQTNPDEVDPELKTFFETYGPPSEEILTGSPQTGAPVQQQLPALKGDSISVKKVMAAVKLAENIRTYGHLAADIYPLNEVPLDTDLLHLENYGLTVEDLKNISADLIWSDAPANVENAYEEIQYLKERYTKKIAFEFSQVNDLEERRWLKDMVESGKISPEISTEKKALLLKRLNEVEGFEKFLHRTYVGQKRFSIEGLDALVPVLDEIISKTVQNGTPDVNIAMAHRGRLNVLAHVLSKPYEVVFSEFQHSPNTDLVPSEGSIGINYGWTGDVKYHLGLDKQITKENTQKARLTLANNPSHLEVVGPIVEGYTRAAQDDRKQSGFPKQDVERSLSILIHGDAAFPGEGITAETLNLSRLKGYQVGGAIHIIANNTIGFTTESEDSRSTKYASDPAKGFEIPIVHVNADDLEACLAAVSLAHQYRTKFKKDFLIDLIGYRRFGHNEMDEPLVTQPQMYALVHKHRTVKEIYAERLLQAGEITKEEIAAIEEQVETRLSEAYNKVSGIKPEEPHELNPPETVGHGLPKLDTAVSTEELTAINENLLKWPEGFTVNKKLGRILSRRLDSFGDNGKIDWAHAEIMAFASILIDGTPIRLTGQDSERGTFAQRNIVLHDSENGKTYSPLHTLENVNASFAVHNSPLTETAVLGFEYGYNVFAPETLVLWEAQFGDFANTGQVIFDQFISAGRAKWGQKSGLVMLLPHGYEGQGPEHSSARLERYLSLAAENNWTVANLSSAAQYFHILRRQAKILELDEVRPLVIMTPKSMLRNQSMASGVSEFSEGEFQSIIETPGGKPEAVERVVFCTGKIAVELREKAASEKDLEWLKIISIEEIYPFPFKGICDLLNKYPNLKEVVWVQEEPKNMGAWSFVEPRINAAAPNGLTVSYFGRKRRSSPAEGDPLVHKMDQQRIMNEAITKTMEGEK